MSTLIYVNPESTGSVVLAAGHCQRCGSRGQCVEVDSLGGGKNPVLKLCKNCWVWLHDGVLSLRPINDNDCSPDN